MRNLLFRGLQIDDVVGTDSDSLRYVFPASVRYDSVQLVIKNLLTGQHMHKFFQLWIQYKYYPYDCSHTKVACLGIFSVLEIMEEFFKDTYIKHVKYYDSWVDSVALVPARFIPQVSHTILPKRRVFTTMSFEKTSPDYFSFYGSIHALIHKVNGYLYLTDSSQSTQFNTHRVMGLTVTEMAVYCMYLYYHFSFGDQLYLVGVPKTRK